jgi:hypothetical protein
MREKLNELRQIIQGIARNLPNQRNILMTEEMDEMNEDEIVENKIIVRP